MRSARSIFDHLHVSYKFPIVMCDGTAAKKGEMGLKLQSVFAPFISLMII